MLVEIINIDFPKVTVEKDGVHKTYEAEPYVEDFLKIGEAEIEFDSVSKKIRFVKNKTTESLKDYANKTENQTGQTQIPTNDVVVNIKGRDHVTYKGLLDLAHKKGFTSFEILSERVSDDMKMAYVKVRLHVEITKKVNKETVIVNRFFDGIGSSTPDNTGSMTQDHPVEMAHTRAKGRALRDFLNIGTAMLEELKNTP